jgi:hypothetical protein
MERRKIISTPIGATEGSTAPGVLLLYRRQDSPSGSEVAAFVRIFLSSLTATALHCELVHEALAGSGLCPSALQALRCSRHEQTTIEYLNDFADVLLERVRTDHDTLRALARVVSEVVYKLTAPPPRQHLTVARECVADGVSDDDDDYDLCAASAAHMSACRACATGARAPGIF